MARFKGRLGAFYVRAPRANPQAITYESSNNVEIGQLRGWDLDVAIDLEDVTDFGDAWREHVQTLRGWTGSCNGFLDPTNAMNHDELLEAVMEASFGGNLATTSGDLEGGLMGHFRLDDSDTDTNRRVFFGDIIIREFTPTVDVEGVIGFTMNFTGNGLLGFTASG